MTSVAPYVDLPTLARLTFDYDADADLASIHLGEPRPAVSEEVDSGWFLRLDDATDEIVGMELHGLKQLAARTPLHARVVGPALQELEGFARTAADEGGFRATGNLDELPRTTQLVILMLGQAI